MRLGIIGLPQSGKTIVFSALANGNQPAIRSGGRFDVHAAVVDVPDPSVIHSDLQKGFIRAEVIGYRDLLAIGGLSESRQHVKVRIEGRSHIV